MKYNTVKAGIRCTVRWTVTNSSAPERKLGAVNLYRSFHSLVQKRKITKSYHLLNEKRPKSLKNAENIILRNISYGPEHDAYWIALAFDNFTLIKDQACAAYARHLKKDAYGKEDTRKVEKTIISILKNEGLWEKVWSHSEWIGVPAHVPIIVEFSKLSLKQDPIKLSSPHDNGMNYEEDCKVALKKIGATVQKTSSGADFGADLLFEYEGYNFVGQCKALNKKAGIKCIQEVVTAKLHYNADGAAAFSISGFSEPAEKIATSNKVMLFEGTNIESIDRQIVLFFESNLVK